MDKQLRMSSYTIPVKLETEEGKYMLIHGYTGAIDIVSEDLYHKIEKTIGKDFNYDVLMTLQKRGYLTYKTKEEEYTYIQRIAKALHKKEMLLYKSFTWVVTYNCNFRCPYCFENRSIKDSSISTVFSKKLVDKTLSVMEKIESNEQLRSKSITLYGGEPLLKENKTIVEYIVKRAMQQGYKLHAITNGYDLNHFMHLLGKDMICDIQITIDGTKEQHNQKRIHYQDSNSFDKIISNIEQILNTKKDVVIKIRVNTDRNNVKDFLSLKQFFEDKGFFKYKTFNVYSALLHDNKAITEKDKTNIEFMSATEYLSAHSKTDTIKYCNGYHSLLKRIKTSIFDGKPIALTPTYCSAQSTGYVFSPLGEIYPCWEVVGNPKHQIGKIVKEDILWKDNILKEWHSHNVGTTSCVHCKYALLCGGGCYATKSYQCKYFRELLKKAANEAFKTYKLS